MTSSVAQWTQHRLFVICILIVLFSFGAFFVYNQMDINLTFNSFCKVPEMEKVLESIEGNNTQVQPLMPERPAYQPNNHTEIIHAADEHTETDIMILIWLWPFGHHFELSCDGFNIKGCYLTADKTLYSKAHAVLFHHRDIRGDLSNMPKQPRPAFQKWVWFNMEPPGNTRLNDLANNLFNLTCNYRLDSHVSVRYGNLVPRESMDNTFKLPPKDKLVCWIISNWNKNYRRVQFYNELRKHISINAYGRAFGKAVNSEDFKKIISSCKFYLSFENSIYKDYITEKLYNPMGMGTVPIVLGPPRINYEEQIPGNSFIHVDDFDTPKKLADKLHYLDQSITEYMSYFHWKQNFEVKRTLFGRQHACQTCHYMKINKGYQATHLNKWFWG